MTITNKQFREYFETQPADKESWRLTKRINRDMIRKKRLKAVQDHVVHVKGNNSKKRMDVENGKHRKHKRFKRSFTFISSEVGANFIRIPAIGEYR